MTHSQEANSSLHQEIKDLKEQLDASQKKLDRYCRLIATLSDELDTIRNNICHTCKKKLVPGSVLPPAEPSSGGHGSSNAALSRITSRWRRILQPRSNLPVNDGAAGSSSKLVAVHNLNKVASQADEAPLPVAVPSGPSNPTTTHVTTKICVSPTTISPVVYNPEVARVLDVQVAHVLTYKSLVLCAKMNTYGNRLAIGLSDGKTHITEVKSGSGICVLSDLYTKRHQSSIRCLMFSPDGQLIVTASKDRIWIWDILQKRVRAVLKGHTNWINDTAFCPSGRFLVSASDDCYVRVWNIRDGSSRKLTDHASSYFVSVAFSPDGAYIAAGDLDEMLRIWDARNHKLLARWMGHTDTVWCMEFTPDGKGLISGSKDTTVKYWDVSSLGIHQPRFRRGVQEPKQGVPEIRRFVGHTKVVRSIAFFPGGRWILTSSNDGSARVWDTQSGVCHLTLQGHTAAIYAVDISRTENFLVTASLDHRVQFWRYEVL